MVSYFLGSSFFKYEILSSEKQVLESVELGDFDLGNGELKQLSVIPKAEKYGCYYIRFNYLSINFMLE